MGHDGLLNRSLCKDPGRERNSRPGSHCIRYATGLQYYCSSLLMQGVPISVVAELLGTSAQMIATTYGHILSGHLADAAEALARRKRS